jgi:hypothetical protein
MTEPRQVFLEADDAIRGQEYVCLSFLTPRKGLLRSKDHFFFSKFLEFYALDYKIRATESFLLGQIRDVQSALSDLLLDIDALDISGAKAPLTERVEKARASLSQKVGADLEAHVKANMGDFRESTLLEDYEKFMAAQQQKLEDEFHKQQNFQTTIHGLKVRGVYSTHDQAVARAKTLAKKDPDFHVYVADVGQWLPWDPDPDQVPESEFQNEELNKLMKGYKENAAKRDAYFEERKRADLAAAAERAAAAKKAGEETTATPDIFGGEDLALQRKKELAGDSISHT